MRVATAKGIRPGTEEWNQAIGYGQGYRPNWYNHSRPVSVPMDNYHTVDMKNQMLAWEREKEQEAQADKPLKNPSGPVLPLHGEKGI